jgi:hypothetical protein
MAARRQTEGLHICPDPFPITDSMKEWFHKNIGTNIPERIVLQQHECFMDWQRSKKPKYHNFEAVWRNHMMSNSTNWRSPLGKYIQDVKKGGVAPPVRSDISSSATKLLDGLESK